MYKNGLLERAIAGIILSCIIMLSACTQYDESVMMQQAKSSQLRSADIVYTEYELREPGTLETLLGNQKATLENLRIKGLFNALDAKCLREMDALKNIDMKKIQIIGGDAVYYSGNKLEDNKIGSWMFYNRGNLNSIILPDGVTEIGEYAFASTGITSIEIPNSIKSIKAYAFNSTNLISVTIPDGTETIGERAFSYCKNLVSVHLPSKLKKIESAMFHVAEKLEVVNIPDGVEVIGDWAFRNTALKSIMIPNSVTSIGEYAFNGVTAISKIELPNSVKFLGKGVFSYCNVLIDCKLSSNIKVIPQECFEFSNKLPSIDIPQNVETIDNRAFYKCTALTSIEIPNHVKRIGENAFSECASLSSVTLSEGLVEIGSYAFSYVPFTALKIPKTVEIIGNYVFSFCSNLEMIVLPEGVKSLGRGIAFECNRLQSLTVPSTLISIEGDLTDCSNMNNLTSVFWNSTCNCEELTVKQNCLVYVSTNAAMPAGLNVIVKGEAESISLVEGLPFNCPQEFLTKKITFKKNFSMKTGNGEAAGWETIVLPFQPTSVKDKAGNVLAPFGSNTHNAKNFWLRELTSGKGYVDATKIEANKPYIIAMPNNPDYDSKYIINGDVSFEASNVTMAATPSELTVSQGPEFTMTPVYRTLPKVNYAYVIDESSERGYKPGSVFISGLRDLPPFEAYITPNRSNKSLRMIRIDGPVRTKSASDNSIKNKM